MAKLKLGPISNEKPVKVIIEMPGALHRDLLAYADILTRETGQPVADAMKLVVPMLEKFIATDREFAKARRAAEQFSSATTKPQLSGSGASSSLG